MLTKNRLVTKISSLLIIFLSTTVFVGWQFNRSVLRQPLPSAPATTPLTALILLCLGAALFQLNRTTVDAENGPPSWPVRLLAGTAVLICLFTAVQFLLRLPPSLELWLFPTSVQQMQTEFPGRPSPHTIIAGTLYGLALILAAMRQPKLQKYHVHLLLVGTLVPWIALFGYITLVDPFYALQGNPQTGMSPITAVSFLTISCGLLAWQAESGIVGLLRSDSPGGRVVRRLLPFTILLSALFGWGIHFGSSHGWFDPSLAYALSWGLGSVGFATLVLHQGFRLHHAFKEREKVATERENALIKLAKEEEKSRTLLESAPDATIVVNEKGNIMLINEQTKVLFGYQREELIEQPIEILLPERYKANHLTHRKGFFAQPKARPMGNGLELYGRHQDGHEFPVEVSLNTLNTPDGPFALATIRDVTQQKLAAETLRQFNVKLEERAKQMTAVLRERNQEIEKANADLQRHTEALEQSNIELQQFAYIASHDLQTPLRSISGFVQLLQQEYKSQLDEQANEWINIAVENTYRMQTIIRDILAYSRVESPTHPFEAIDLNDVYYEVTALLKNNFEEKQAEIKSTKLPTVMGNRVQLILLFQNLIGNGIKYNTNSVPEIQVSATSTEAEWIISVQDNGIGINPDYYSMIFEIFRRLHTQDEFSGNGIGLAICRRVVDRHGGRIWIESAPIQGSIFKFTLPK